MLLNLTPKTNDTFVFIDESMSSKTAKAIAYGILFVISLFGNVLIIWAIGRDKSLRTTTNKLIANMAVSDLLVPLFGIQEEILHIYNGTHLKSGWQINQDLGDSLCKLIHFFQDTSITVSVYSCVFIAIDRYYAIAHPLKLGFSRRRLRLIITSIWILAVFTGFPSLIKYRMVSYKNQNFCSDNWSHIGLNNMKATRVQMFTMFTILNGIPIPLITTLYILIAVKMCKQKAPGEASEISESRREKRIKKVLKLSVVIIGLLFVSWLCLDLVLFFGLLGHLDQLSFYEVRELVFTVKFIAFSSSSYNFFIYLTFCEQYRKNFKIILSNCCMSKS